jgi:hypothetical protein
MQHTSEVAFSRTSYTNLLIYPSCLVLISRLGIVLGILQLSVLSRNSAETSHTVGNVTVNVFTAHLRAFTYCLTMFFVYRLALVIDGTSMEINEYYCLQQRTKESPHWRNLFLQIPIISSVHSIIPL